MKNFLKLMFTALAMVLLSGAYSASTGEPAPDGVVMMAAAVTVDTSALQSYGGKFGKQLLMQTLNGLDIAQDITVIRNLRAPRHLPKLTVGAGLRPHNTAVETADNPGRAWSSRTISPREAMKIFEVIPSQYRDTFMSEMLAPGALREPFAAWAWAREMEKLQDEINEVSYTGVYNADAAAFNPASTYSEGDFVNFEESIYECIDDTTAGQSPTTHEAKWTKRNAESIADGLGTVIAGIVSNSEIPSGNIINSGAITDENAVDAVENQYHSIPERYRKKGLIAYVSWDFFNKYQEHFKTKYPHSKLVNEDHGDGRIATAIYGSGKRAFVKPCTWMQDSSRIIMTRKENLLMGTDQLSDSNRIAKSIETIHGYKSIAHFILAYQVADTEWLFINEQA